MKPKVLYRKRDFLNSPSSSETGTVQSTATYEEFSYGEGKPPLKEIDAAFVLSDCYRQVSLDLGAMSKAQAKRRLNKIDTILIHLTGLRGAISNNMERLK